MKRPSSPVCVESESTVGSELCVGLRRVDGDPRPKRERKQRTLTLCEVCNIQLNSSAQAQIHYNGKTHQRRLRQASQAKNNRTGSPLLASLPLPGRTLQPQLDLKHILPLRINGSSPLSLFPNFNTMDPVQKAVISHTFGLPQPIKKKQIISCNICHLRFNSTVSESLFLSFFLSFYVSFSLYVCPSIDSDHLRNFFFLSFSPSFPPFSSLSPQSPPLPGAPTSCHSSRVIGLIDVVMVAGSKHKLMLEGQCVQPRRRGGKVASSRMNPRPKRHGNKNSATSSSQSYHCDVCDIAVNSETQLKQHMSSRRHKDRLAGKPPKPKFSPYTKSSASSVLATKLALQKELSKTLAASFLPSPLTPATLCTMAANPLTLRHTHGATAYIQTPLLSPALFRPAPGPLRAAHAPIIFSPY
uniref:Zinc finger protein 385C n=1 Tax=Astyanax mexicanus TaxID=7994 RepID=A0A8B9KL52_ASTMX